MTQPKKLITYEPIMKPSYILNVTYPMATVIAKIHRPAVAMSAPRSMFLAVCDIDDSRFLGTHGRG
jgi:hypothetical protein